MFRNNSLSKSARFSRAIVHLSLSALALLILVLPAFAANHQPLTVQGSFIGNPADIAMAAGDTTGRSQPNAICPAGGQCFADVLPGSAFYTFTNTIYQQDLVTGFPCGGPGEPCDSQSRPYYRPGNSVTRQQMAKFIDNARELAGIHMVVSSTIAPIYIENSVFRGIEVGVVNTYGVLSHSQTGDGLGGTSESGYGVYGASASGDGVHGISANTSGVRGEGVGAGVSGHSTSGPGVNGASDAGNGVVGFSGNSGTGSGIYGYSATNRAGYFSGNVQVTGSLSKGAGSFKIDDPLDPANKYLYHSFVESPDMLNIYRGTVAIDDKGEATVTMPAYFEALNRDFDYQLTSIGAPGPDLFIAQEIKGNQFKIAGGKPGSKVSWQVTGTRQDPYANAHRIPVEEEKPANEKGKYLHPIEWGQPASSGVDYEQQQMIEQQAAQAPSER